MAAVDIRQDELVVTLSRLERVAALRRQIRIPMASVRSICADPDPWGALRGVRSPGTGIPGVAAYGVRRMTGNRPDFAAVHGRGPALRIECEPTAPYSRILVTVADAEASASALSRGCTDAVTTPGPAA
jgi:hypothetical protein